MKSKLFFKNEVGRDIDRAVVAYLRHHHYIRLDRLKKITRNLGQDRRARSVQDFREFCQ
jgi:hypothetical protein